MRTLVTALGILLGVAAGFTDRVVFLKDGRVVDELKLDGGCGETAKILERLKALE